MPLHIVARKVSPLAQVSYSGSAPLVNCGAAKYDPEHWRKRANEARSLADDMKDKISKQTMLQIADYLRAPRKACRTAGAVCAVPENTHLRLCCCPLSEAKQTSASKGAELLARYGRDAPSSRHSIKACRGNASHQQCATPTCSPRPFDSRDFNHRGGTNISRSPTIHLGT